MCRVKTAFRARELQVLDLRGRECRGTATGARKRSGESLCATMKLWGASMKEGYEAVVSVLLRNCAGSRPCRFSRL